MISATRPEAAVGVDDDNGDSNNDDNDDNNVEGRRETKFSSMRK